MLVIIGLIVGGVLVGQDLIKAAQARKIISEKDALDAAVNTFKGKYNCLPGDCANATNFWGQAGGCGPYGNSLTPGGPTCNGNGNGLIEWGDGVSKEAQNFWQHLYNAGLTNLPYPAQIGVEIQAAGTNDAAVPGQNVPMSGTGLGAWEAVYWNAQMVTQIYGGCGYPWSSFVGSCWGQANVLEFIGSAAGWGQGGNAVALTPMMLLNIDTKVDDGLPDQGSIRGGWGTTVLCTVTNGSLVSYRGHRRGCSKSYAKPPGGKARACCEACGPDLKGEQFTRRHRSASVAKSVSSAKKDGSAEALAFCCCIT